MTDAATPLADITESDPVDEDDAPALAGRLSNWSAALVPGLIGLSAAVGSLVLGIGSPAEPGPGLWPLIISVVIIAGSVLLMLKGPRAHGAEKFTGSSRPVLLGVLTIIGFIVALPTVGFEIPTLLLCFAWLYFLGRERLRLSIITSLVTTVLFYALFIMVLRVPLPRLF